MRISRSSRTGDELYESLKKFAEKMPGSDEHIDQRLDEQREKEGHAHEGGTEEAILASDRKEDKTIGQRLTEKNLREHEGKEKEPDVITEKQLNDAPKENSYPHRNAAAYERTGDKRQINALEEELGNASDAAKLDRYEKASKAKGGRLLDKNVGEQMTNDKTKIKNAFNLKQRRQASMTEIVGDYLSYRSNDKAYNRKFAEAGKIDDAMGKIMVKASTEKRDLSDQEKAEILSLKTKKAELLGIPQGSSESQE